MYNDINTTRGNQLSLL